MLYFDGSAVTLGDVVNVPVPGGTAKARVVMLGETYEHLDIDADFLAWVQQDRGHANASCIMCISRLDI